MTPIWKDINVNLQSTAQQEAYTIDINYTTVYNGICYGENAIRINDIVADYFTRQMPSFGISTESNGEKAVANVRVNNSAGDVVFSDIVIDDYSYEAVDLDTHIPYAPISRIIDSRAPIVGTVFCDAQRLIGIDGTTEAVATPLGSTFTKYIPATINKVAIGNFEWEVVSGCAQYALYLSLIHI